MLIQVHVESLRMDRTTNTPVVILQEIVLSDEATG